MTNHESLSKEEKREKPSNIIVLLDVYFSPRLNEAMPDEYCGDESKDDDVYYQDSVAMNNQVVNDTDGNEEGKINSPWLKGNPGAWEVKLIENEI